MSHPTAGRHSPWLEVGLGLVVIAVPLAFVPASSAPFVDVKLVLVLAGTVAVWAGHRDGSLLAVPAAVWVGVMAVAVLAGVDPWWSLAGPENTGNGILLLGASAVLLVAGAGIPVSVRSRVPVWLVGTSTAVATVSLLYRLWPGAFELIVPGLSFQAGTLGNTVFLGGLMATGLVAAVGLTRLGPGRLVASLVVLSTGLALSGNRAGWVALVVGLAVALWRSRPPRRRALIMVGVVVATLGGWTVVDAVADPPTPFSGAGRFGELTSGSARWRGVVLASSARGWSQRPVLGWGPGNTWSASVAAGTTSELRVTRRGFGDAHNLLVESAVTTGAVGLGALLVLVGLTVREMRRGSPSSGWAAGGATALAVYHLLQPVNVSLTPMFFLLAGLACRSPTGDEAAGEAAGPEVRMRSRMGSLRRAGVGLLLAGGLLVGVVVLTASILEQYGRTYYSEWSLRASLLLTPRRITAAEALALSLALDGRGGDEEARREALELAARTVRLHPWNPRVRLVAADVHILVHDWVGAVRWVERHLARFPTDAIPRPPETPPPPLV